MNHKGFAPIIVVLILAAIALVMGGIWYLGHNVAGGGGSDQIAPDSVQAGQPVVVKIDLSVWGGGGPVNGRYTDVNFYYRLVGESSYHVLQSNPAPVLYTGDQAKFNGNYEEYSFAIPPYPANTSGSIEYYYEMKLDGVQNHANGIKTVKVIPVGIANISSSTNINTSTTTSSASHWKIYHNDKYGYEFQYPADWKVNTNTDGSSITVATPSEGEGLSYEVNFDVSPNWRGLTAKALVANELAVDSVRYIEDGGIGGYRYDKEFPVTVNGTIGDELYNVFAYDESMEEITFAQNGYTYGFSFPVATTNSNLLNPAVNNPIAHQILSSLKLFSPTVVAPNWKTHKIPNTNISFQFYPDWMVASLATSAVTLYSPSSTVAIDAGDVEVPPDINVIVSDNPSSLPLDKFVSSDFSTYGIISSTTINGKDTLIGSDIQASVPRNPVIAVFMQTCERKVIEATLFAAQTASGEAGFNELLQTISDSACK